MPKKSQKQQQNPDPEGRDIHYDFDCGVRDIDRLLLQKAKEEEKYQLSKNRKNLTKIITKNGYIITTKPEKYYEYYKKSYFMVIPEKGKPLSEKRK